MRPPPLSPDEARQNIAVLQCLVRLASTPEAAEALLEAPNALGRLFSCLGCGDEAVALEASRVLLRLWAPHSARTGAGANARKAHAPAVHMRPLAWNT